MRTAEEEYKDIIDMDRPEDPDILRKYPRMPLEERAKIFAPFEALRGHSERLSEEVDKLNRQERPAFSEEEAESLSKKISGLKNGDHVSVTFFQPDEEDTGLGYCMEISGVLKNVDTDFGLLTVAAAEGSSALMKNEDTSILLNDIINVERI